MCRWESWHSRRSCSRRSPPSLRFMAGKSVASRTRSMRRANTRAPAPSGTAPAEHAVPGRGGGTCRPRASVRRAPDSGLVPLSRARAHRCPKCDRRQEASVSRPRRDLRLFIRTSCLDCGAGSSALALRPKRAVNLFQMVMRAPQAPWVQRTTRRSATIAACDRVQFAVVLPMNANGVGGRIGTSVRSKGLFPATKAGRACGNERTDHLDLRLGA